MQDDRGALSGKKWRHLNNYTVDLGLPLSTEQSRPTVENKYQDNTTIRPRIRNRIYLDVYCSLHHFLSASFLIVWSQAKKEIQSFFSGLLLILQGWHSKINSYEIDLLKMKAKVKVFSFQSTKPFFSPIHIPQPPKTKPRMLISIQLTCNNNGHCSHQAEKMWIIPRFSHSILPLVYHCAVSACECVYSLSIFNLKIN